MTKQKSFFTELLLDMPYALALMVIFTTISGLTIWTIGQLAELIFSHGDFMTKMTTEIMQNMNLREMAVWVVIVCGVSLIFGLIIGKVMAGVSSNCPKAGE